MKSMYKVVIIEDDENIRDLVLYALRSSGYDFAGYENGAEFFESFDNEEPPNLILLDIMLPGEDGISLLKRIRSTAATAAAPVIMLTAKGEELDKVRALDLGADDYITKPFGVMELLSRVSAVLRRSVKDPAPDKLCAGEIVLYPQKREVFIGKERAALTFKEFELLHYLLINKGIVLSREKLMDVVWGYDYEGESRTVDMHVKTLRQKLGEAGARITTVRNVGYKITVD